MTGRRSNRLNYRSVATFPRTGQQPALRWSGNYARDAPSRNKKFRISLRSAYSRVLVSARHPAGFFVTTFYSTAAMNVIEKIEREQLKQDVPDFRAGDTLDVHTRVVEGGKERIQIFKGIVIARRGTRINEAFTVRKISNGEGVERVFQIHSPKVAKIEVVKRGKVRRAKLHYLRGRVGKQAASVKELGSN